MKMLFISKDNLTTNPRLFKELKFAVEQGHQVHFIATIGVMKLINR